MGIVTKFQEGLRALTAEGYWNALEYCGWVAEIPERERNTFRKRVGEAFASDPTEAFLALAICPDRPGPDGGATIEEIVLNFASASFGRFNPVNIASDRDADGKRVRISFKHKGRTYRKETAVVDPISPEVVGLVNDALADVDEPARFHQLVTLDMYRAYFVFLTPATYSLAQRRGLVPPEEYATAFYR